MGKYDEFKVLGPKPIADFEMKIYNRWEILSISRRIKTLDGMGNSRIRSSGGVYVYVISWTPIQKQRPF
jgi:hypothetical protein